MAINELFKGITWTRRITVTDEDTQTLTNLTGKPIVLELRRRTGESVLVSLSVGSGITILTQSGGTLGQADIVITGAQSTNLNGTPHVYSVLVDAQVVIPPTLLEVRSL